MTSPNHNDTRKLLQVIGQVDVFEDSTTSDTAISVFTADGDEYVVVARKIVKRLLRFAGEEIDIEFLGYVTHDASTGLDVLSVVNFKPTSEEDDKAAADTASDYDRNRGPKKRKKTIVQELDDEDVNAEDFDQAEGFDTIIIHDDDLAALPLDDDEDSPPDDDDLVPDDDDLVPDDDDLVLDDDDNGLSVLNAFVQETPGKTVAAASEPARDDETAASPTEKTSATDKPSPTGKTGATATKIPRPRHAQNKTALGPDASTDHGRQTAKTGKETAVERDLAPAARTPKAANQSPTSGKSPAPKTARAVDAKTPAKSEARKDTKARTAPEPTRMRKTPPPTPKLIPGQTHAATKTPRKPDRAKHAAAPPAPKKKSPPPPAKQVPSQAPKKTAPKPTAKKVPGQATKATRPQDANGAAAAKNQPKAAKTKTSSTVVSAAPKTAPKPSGPARSRKRPS